MNLRFEILKAVAASPGAPINEIADAISYDRQKTAWSVRDCAQDGLLAKRLDDVTRQPGYTLTDAGKKRLAEGPAKLQGGNLKKGAKTKTSFNAGPRDRADAKVESVSEPAAAEATVKESLTVVPERAPELPAEVSTAGQAAEDDRKEIDLILVRPRVLEDLEISKRARDSYRESRDVLSRELDTIRALLAHRVTGPIDPSDFTEVELAEKAAEMIDEAVNEISHAWTAVREKDDELLKQACVVVELRDQLANQTALVEKLEHLLQSARNEAEHLRQHVTHNEDGLDGQPLGNLLMGAREFLEVGQRVTVTGGESKVEVRALNITFDLAPHEVSEVLEHATALERKLPVPF